MYMKQRFLDVGYVDITFGGGFVGFQRKIH
jgi:hypothetical protein